MSNLDVYYALIPSKISIVSHKISQSIHDPVPYVDFGKPSQTGKYGLYTNDELQWNTDLTRHTVQEHNILLIQHQLI